MYAFSWKFLSDFTAIEEENKKAIEGSGAGLKWQIQSLPKGDAGTFMKISCLSAGSVYKCMHGLREHETVLCHFLRIVRLALDVGTAPTREHNFGGSRSHLATSNETQSY